MSDEPLVRDFLTGLAIILIVVLTTLLVAPYFVDWNGQRGLLETQLSRALGQKVTIGGNIDLKLLPTPYLRLNQTVIGSDDGAVRVGIRHLDLELSVAPLLHGEFDIVEGRLEEPTIRVTLQMDRNLPALPDTPALRANIRIERVQVVDGTLAIADPQSGRTFVVDHLDFSAESPSLAGPYKGSGTQGSGEARTKFRFSTTTPTRGKTRVRLALDETLRHPALDIDGDVALSRVAGQQVRQTFAGTLAASGHVLEARNAIPWQLTAPLSADPQSASFANGQLRIGREDAALTLQANGDATFGEASVLHLKLNAQQLDVDRLSGAPVDQTRPPPPKLPPIASLKQLIAAVTPPFPTDVDIAVETATWGGETLNGLVAHLPLGGSAPRPMRVSGDGPGGLHLDLRGAPTDSALFAGQLVVAANNLPTSLRWLAAVTTLNVPGELPFRAASVAGKLTVAANAADVADMTLGFDRTTLHGSAHVATGDRTKISANLTTAALDLDGLPDLQAIEKRAVPFDIALVLDAGALKIAHAGSGRLDAGHVHLDAAVDGLGIVVKTFSAENLGGATVKASGSADETAASLSMILDAGRLDQMMALAQRVLPGSITDDLAARAAELAPAKLKVDAKFEGARNQAKLTPTRLDVTGTLADTRINIHLSPDPTSDGVTLVATAEAAHARTLLGQFGLPNLPLDVVGASRISLAAHGPRQQPLKTSIDAVFGGTRVTANGSFELLTGSRLGGSGTVNLSSADAAPLLQTLALVPFDMTDRLPVDLTAGLALGNAGFAISDLKGRFDGIDVHGALHWQKAGGDAPALTGSLNVDRLAIGSLLSVVLGAAKPPAAGAAWSNEPFAAELSDLPRTALALRAETVDLGLGLHAKNAAMDLGIAPDVLTLKHGTAELAGGRVSGDLMVRRDGLQAFLEGSVAVDKAALDIAPIKASVGGKFDFAGGGQSQLALVTSLAGTGQMTLDGTSVSGANSRALPAAFAATENDTLAVDDESIRRALEETSNGSLALGTRHFAIGLAGGSLTLTARDGSSAAVGPVEASLGGSFDLRQPQFEVDLDEVLRALPKGWTGAAPSITVRQVAKLGGAPTLTFDVSAFTNAVAARAIARESARIESYEFDIRERALFNARLESDRRREQDRLKTEADARAAAEAARRSETERKARAEAARQERQREDRAAKGRENAPEPGLSKGDIQPSPDRFGAPPPGASADPSAAGRY